jgi:hypothetical protein
VLREWQILITFKQAVPSRFPSPSPAPETNAFQTSADLGFSLSDTAAPFDFSQPDFVPQTNFDFNLDLNGVNLDLDSFLQDYSLEGASLSWV